MVRRLGGGTGMGPAAPRTVPAHIPGHVPPVAGRHRRNDDGKGRRIVTVLLAIVATGGLATLILTSAGGSRDDPAPGPAAPSTAPVDQVAAVREVTRACETAVATARNAVAAARPSYSHWAGHVRAQLDYDAGTATLEQTRARWASTKATADADLAAFATAYAAYDAAKDGCAERAAPADQDPVMTECRSVFAPASAAVAAGRAVVDDWTAHVEMMKGKEHADPAQYGQMWRDMVRNAPANLDRFAKASLALADAAGCPRPE